jgi:PAS domain S-box-containing protein
MGGYRAKDLRGKHFSDLTYSDDIETSSMAFRRVITGESEYSDLEKRYICADGSIRWGRVRLTRLDATPPDRGPRVLALVEDITERKLIAEALAREKAFSDHVIAESPNLVVGIAPDGRTTFMNPAAERATGYRSEDLVGSDWWATTYPGIEQEQVTRLFARFRRNDDVSEYPMTLTRRDGGKRVISWNYLNRTGADGYVHELIGYGRDITAEHEAQAQQQQQDKLRALGEMAGGMAHEINNALQPIVGMIGIIGERAGAYEPALGDQAEMLEAYCLHARKVVSDVLAFARTEGPETEVFDATELMTDVTAFIVRMIPSRIQVRTVGFGQDDPALPDGTRIRVSRNGMIQIVQNLVSNAADAMGGRGRITISLAPAVTAQTAQTAGGASTPASGGETGARPPFLRISVTDEGPGMDEVTKAELFNPFFSTKPIGQGTGLGLSVVYGLLTHWGGAIDVDSAPSAGTRIAVTLPTVPDPTCDPAAPDLGQGDSPDQRAADPVPG